MNNKDWSQSDANNHDQHSSDHGKHVGNNTNVE